MQDNLASIRKALQDNRAVVMGIMNVTPDSFYTGSRCSAEGEIAARADQILEEGGRIIDIGACSTRPGSTPVAEDEECRRLTRALDIVCRRHPDAVLSVDTFRPTVARMCIERYGVRIINDVSGGCEEMFTAVKSRKEGDIIYILTSTEPLTQTMSTFEAKIKQLEQSGCNGIWLDPGYGFGKDMTQNYEMLACQERLLSFGMPILAGVSRKRMAWQLLGISPEEALNGTTVLNTLCLAHGASILRVHDVKEAREVVTIMEAMHR